MPECDGGVAAAQEQAAYMLIMEAPEGEDVHQPDGAAIAIASMAEYSMRDAATPEIPPSHDTIDTWGITKGGLIKRCKYFAELAARNPAAADAEAERVIQLRQEVVAMQQQGMGRETIKKKQWAGLGERRKQQEVSAQAPARETAKAVVQASTVQEIEVAAVVPTVPTGDRPQLSTNSVPEALPVMPVVKAEEIAVTLIAMTEKTEQPAQTEQTERAPEQPAPLVMLEEAKHPNVITVQEDIAATIPEPFVLLALSPAVSVESSTPAVVIAPEQPIAATIEAQSAEEHITEEGSSEIYDTFVAALRILLEPSIDQTSEQVSSVDEPADNTEVMNAFEPVPEPALSVEAVPDLPPPPAIAATVVERLVVLEPEAQETVAPLLQQLAEKVHDVAVLAHTRAKPEVVEAVQTEIEVLVADLFEQLAILYQPEDVKHFAVMLLAMDARPVRSITPESFSPLDLEHLGTHEVKLRLTAATSIGLASAMLRACLLHVYFGYYFRYAAQVHHHP